MELSEVCVDVAAAGDGERFRDVPTVHHLPGDTPGIGETNGRVDRHRRRWLALPVFSARAHVRRLLPDPESRYPPGGVQRPPRLLPSPSMIGQSGLSSPLQASTRWARSSCSDCSSRCFSAISASRFMAMRFTSALDRCWSS